MAAKFNDDDLWELAELYMETKLSRECLFWE